MNKPYILAIDEGTTNAKAIIVDKEGVVITKASVAIGLTNPRPGWAEQDPLEIWQACQSAISQCLETLSVTDLAGIAISNQRESVMAWDRNTGAPLSALISWQCGRTEQLCREIAKREGAHLIKGKSGSVLDPMFSASKISWLLQDIPNGYARARDAEICVGSVDSWLVWNFSGGQKFVTDFSNASRYQLLNIHNHRWDEQLLEIFNIPKACLPEIVSSSGVRAVTHNCGFLPDGIAILSQIGDSHAALYGQGGFNSGAIKATYGTGSSLMAVTEQFCEHDYGVSTTVAWHDGTAKLALEGNITHIGSALAFVAKLLNVKDVATLSEMAQSVPDNAGVYFVPALSGLGAPHWQSQARGLICGLTDATTPAHIARAAFEAITYQVADLFNAMQKTAGNHFDTLLVDGGPTANRWLMQYQADVLQRPIIINDLGEISALGSVYLAGRALGWWSDYAALNALAKSSTRIVPNKKSATIDNQYKRWQQSVARAI